MKGIEVGLGVRRLSKVRLARVSSSRTPCPGTLPGLLAVPGGSEPYVAHCAGVPRVC